MLELAQHLLVLNYQLSIYKTNTSAGNDWLFELFRNTGTGTSVSKGTGMYFRDANSIQAGISASRPSSAANYNSDLIFYTNSSVSGTNPDASLTEKMRIASDGKVGIGTTAPDSDALLTVKGAIHSTEIKVLANAGVPDYVLERRLRTQNT